MGYNIGPKIGIEGEREFRQQLKNINDTYKALEAETKAVAKAFEAQGDEQGKLEAVSKQLAKQIDEQKKKLVLLEDAVAKASEKYGENSIEATRLRGALFDTKTTIAQLEAELGDTQSTLDKTEAAMEGLESSTKDAGDAALTFQDVVNANWIADAVMDGLRELGNLLKDFAVESIETAAGVKAATAQYEQAFGDMQQRATESLAAISDDTNIASTRIQGSFTKIYSFAKTSGADSAQALNLSSRAMVAAADSAAYYDSSIEEATERLQAFLKGNYANDAALGISATETTRNAKANELYAKSFKELTEVQKVDTLLAMVEAGNKASGAFGQAARESDGWENVLGELAEVFRMIQAEAGKPALKKLTPVIQRITKSGYELIEDIDWEGFGETVERIADGVIDYGPDIVRVIAAVASGIAAFQAVKKTGEFVSLAASFLGVGASATTAGTAVAASGAVAAATPWGAIAAVVGVAVSAITVLATQSINTQTELEKVTERLEKNIARAEEAYAQSKADTEGAAHAAEYYIGRLQQLEVAGVNTAVAQREYQMIVEQLNELIPTLNLHINEQTGLIDMQTAAIKQEVAAWKQNAIAQALHEKIEGILKSQAEATTVVLDKQVELGRVTREYERITEDLTKKEQERKKIEDQMRSISEKLTSTTELSAEEAEKLRNELMDLSMQEHALGNEIASTEQNLTRCRNEQTFLTDEISKAQAVVDSYQGAILQAQESLDFYNQTTAAAAQTQSELTDEQQAVKTSIENLVAAYDEAKTAAMESINSQIGYFEDLSGESEWSAEQIIKNWESQRAAFENYTANLQAAVDMGLDKTLVQQLSDGTVESMQILDALVNDADINVDEINASFSRTQEAKDSMASAMATLETECDAQWETIAGDAKNAGLDIAEGAARGVNQRSWKFIDAISSMAKGGQDWWNKIWERHSPSRWMGEASEDIVDGGAINIERYADRFANSMENLALAGQSAFLQAQMEHVAAYPDMVAASVVNNQRRITNMGGFVVNISQQPGESATDLAYRVMDIIETEVRAKGDVFGGK